MNEAVSLVGKSDLTLAALVPVYNEQYLVQASLRRLLVLGESAHTAPDQSDCC